MMELISNLSTASGAVAIIVVFVTLSLACLCVVRRYCKPFLFSELTNSGEIFADAIAVFFALILAFVTIAVWQNNEKVNSVVAEEANTLNTIYRNLEAYPEPLGTESRMMIRLYVKRVITDEWPKLALAQQDETAHLLLGRINRKILTFQPRNNGELVLHQETMKSLGEYRGMRHNRLVGGKPKLRAPMWFTLIMGTILYIMYVCFLDVPDFRRHAFMVGTLAALIAVVFYLLLVYNYPFSEPGAIDSGSFQDLLEYWKNDTLPAQAVK
jgi:hypothetical protein